MNYKILLFFISFLFFLSCNKDETTNHYYQYINIDSALYPLLFDTGSYWVYENEINKIIDSISLININKYYLPPVKIGQESSLYFEEYNLKYSSSISGIYDEQLVGYIISKGSTNGGYIYLGSHQVGDSSQNANIDTIYDTLIIAGNTYFNVVKMQCRKDQYLSDDLNLYYADSIGLIKKVIIEGEMITDNWNLLRYKTNLLKVE